MGHPVYIQHVPDLPYHPLMAGSWDHLEIKILLL